MWFLWAMFFRILYFLSFQIIVVSLKSFTHKDFLESICSKDWNRRFKPMAGRKNWNINFSSCFGFHIYINNIFLNIRRTKINNFNKKNCLNFTEFWKFLRTDSGEIYKSEAWGCSSNFNVLRGDVYIFP